jgi:hypothetical protein
MEKKNQPAPSPMHTVPEHVRRGLAEDYRAIANGKRFTKAERAEFARMAERWASTLPENNRINNLDER